MYIITVSHITRTIINKENLDVWVYKWAHSEELQATIGEKIDAALIELGAECGCEFTAHELHDHFNRREDKYTHQIRLCRFFALFIYAYD